MKKLLAIFILSLAIDTSMGQANLSMSMGNKLNFQLEGAFVDEPTGIAVAAGFIKNMQNLETDPFILHIKAGYEFLLGNDFNLTAMAGYASHKFTGSETPNNYKEDHTIYSLEAGKDWYMGRLFAGANHTGTQTFFNIGIKVKIL